MTTLKGPVWPGWSLGTLLALLVLCAVLVIAFIGQVKVVNLDLWLFGLLALARIL